MTSIVRIVLVAVLAGSAVLPPRLSAAPKDLPQEQAKLAAWQRTLLDDRSPKAAREAALTQMAGSKAGGLVLLDLASQKKLPPALMETTGELISRNPDLGVRALATQYFPRPSRSGEPFPPLTELAKLRGDARRGREIFLSDTAACATCHRMGTEGRDIGPDLTQIATKLDRPGLFDAILNPNGALTFGYEPWLITTKDDEIFTGFILVNGEEVILKETSGEHRVIPAGDITRRQQQTLSIMPDNISLGLTPAELADVVEYLLRPPLPDKTKSAK